MDSNPELANCQDLRKLIFMLHSMGHEYKKLLEFCYPVSPAIQSKRTSAPRQQAKTKHVFIDMLYSGIDCAKLKDGERLFEISLPSSFNMESIGVALRDPNDSAPNRSGYYTDLQFVISKKTEDMIGSHSDYFLGEGEFIKLNTDNPTIIGLDVPIPKGWHIAQGLLVSRAGSEEWLDNALLRFPFL